MLNMTIAFLLSFWLIVGSEGNTCQSVADPCSLTSYHDIPYMYTRDKTVGFFGGLTNRTYCDQYQIDIGVWYRSNYNITTECVGIGHCGTQNPVWMNGTIPSPSEGVVSRTACKSTASTCCERSYSLAMKNCGTYTTYCFIDVPTACYQRYCFNVGEDSTNSTTECPGTDLPQLTDRSIHTDTLTIIVNDQNLTDTWFKTQQGGIQYLMADSTNMPEVDSCDPHPDISTMADGSVLWATACLRSYNFDCDQSFTVKIRKCGQEIQYYLQNTVRYAGYCFDIGYNLSTTTVTTTTSTITITLTPKSASVTTGTASSGGGASSSASGVSQTSEATTVGKITGPEASSSPSVTVIVLIAVISVLMILLVLLMCYIIKRQMSNIQSKTVTHVMPIKMTKDRMFDGREPTITGVLPAKTDRMLPERGGYIPMVMPANTNSQHSVANVPGIHDPPPAYDYVLGTN